jgi:hypothetical protein
MIGRDQAMRVMVEGNYLVDEDTPESRRPSPALVSRLITARVAG